MSDTATLLELVKVNTRLNELATANQLLIKKIEDQQDTIDQWMRVACTQQDKLNALRERDLKAELNKETT